MKQLGTRVQYFGIDLVILHPYVATDKDGAVYNYSSTPEISDTHRTPGWISTNTGEMDYVAKVDLEGMDWKDTLVKFKLED